MRNVFPNPTKDNNMDNSKNNTNYNSMDNTKDTTKDNTNYNTKDISNDNTNYNTKDITNDNIHTHTCTHSNEKYILSMFPYPSGNLHMGHARVYSISDCLARFQTLKRHRVFHPMGWDSFGLPAENAAIGAGIQPADWTERNISQMRTQLHSLGFDFNWEAELRTSDPKYYKWTQWLFIKMHQRGWAYRKEAPVFWDPVDCTVLAAEQVDTQGRSWRSGAKVETRMLAQWYWKITEFADDLIVGLEKLDWPDSIKEMQKNWIGKVEACTIDFPIENDTIKVYTTTPHKLPLVHQILLHPKHKLAHLKHLEARNPLTGQRIAVLVADSPVDQEHTEEQAVMREPEEQQAQMLSEEQVRELFRSGIAHGCVRYRMRDWLISRQRAWGTPIPILYCPEHGPQTLKDHQLPLRLPNEISYPTTASNIVASPLAQNHSWTHSAKCPICNGPAVRETDTMDTFVDSSWYFLRFLDPHNTEKPFNPRFLSPNKPVVDWYIGGIEHAILHLLYARFITKVFADIEGLGRECEPFRKLLAQGLVQGQTRRCAKTNRYLKPDEHITDSNSDSSVLVTWEKMSKSKFNGVQPQSLIEKYGSDSIRLAMLFKAPPAISLNWDEKDIIGHERFLTRLLLQLYSTSQTQKVIDDSKWSEEMVQVAKLFNETIDHIKRDMEEASSPAFNVHIAMLMKLSNRLIDNVNDMPFEFKWTCLSKFAALLSPYAPCTATELADICLRTAPHIQKSTVPLDPLQIPQEAIESFNSNTSIAIYLNGKEVGKLLVPLEDLKNTSKLEQTAKGKFPQLESALNSFLVQGKQKLMINFVNSK